MAKKKNKPDFSRPKEEALEEKKQKAAEKARAEESDFITPGAVNGITVAPDGTVTATGDTDPEDAEYDGLPLVVIAGRPNVGKSTLFNRFLHHRVAIVNDQPGDRKSVV